MSSDINKLLRIRKIKNSVFVFVYVSVEFAKINEIVLFSLIKNTEQDCVNAV